MKKLGAHPTGLKPDGSPMYTLPVIHDDSTGALISDSALIAEYLDKTYPTEMIGSKTAPFALLLLPQMIREVVNGPSAEYVTRNYLPRFGISSFATWTMSEEQRVAEWEKVKEFLGSVHAMMKAEDRWIMGDEVSFADFAVGAVLEMLKTLFGKDSEEWKGVVGWHDGRWGRMMTELEKYSAVY
ncbi:hypothetical protein BDP27DRAFT_1448928 [Rhodocollybia butyracea]|uniref:GST N-terminal domain-containing protein n=1 Tax=Rhodocollybia butyracea TaxID=206335 RepID=A0A9P5U6C0_9AGAR|nr:hypothetical protein BDP27DRAFT_1448928 [Rhodocollybia butyracea]